MLVSAIFTLGVPRQARPVSGDHAHAALLRLLADRSPALAASLHESTRHKPFTVSPVRLLDGAGRGGAELRVTAVGKAMSDALLDLVDRPPRLVTLNHAEWPVTCATADGRRHPWAATTSYDELSEVARSSPARVVLMRFHSPAAFAADAHNRVQLLPTPALVFRHLGGRWARWAPEGAEAWPDPSDRLLVRRVEIGSTSQTPTEHVGKGFVGECEYELTPDGATAPGEQEHLARLCRFAFFSGVGMATARGMGQVESTVLQCGAGQRRHAGGDL